MQRYIDTYLQSLKNTKQPSTLKRYEYDLKHFHLWLQTNKHTIKNPSPTRDDLQLYYTYLVDNHCYSKNSVRRVLSVLKQYFHYYKKKDYVEMIEDFIYEQRRLRSIDQHEILDEKEIIKLFQTLRSNAGLTDNQKKFRHLFIDRNEMIMTLMLHYGLSVQEVVNITVNNIHFSSNKMEVIRRQNIVREVVIKQEDKEKLYSYFQSIPSPVRPNRYDKHYFFIAFDYQRGTYRWDYETNAPKPLTVVAIQKMVRTEMRRTGLHSGSSASSLRKTYIIQELLRGRTKQSLQKELAFKTTQPLDPYIDFVENRNII
ncbi:site-specific integrase [Bacillus shivajii]|uniref:tyrosine-type recombinase/integrase n=1 Tax=Bacillus shivajii TaxID=1983719 RepID=UPI001CFC3191|nr:site-specific integrase [Bacillus shivajii]UCZ51638.1 site-specific integrase [Bacillus shivajii]